MKNHYEEPNLIYTAVEESDVVTLSLPIVPFENMNEVYQDSQK